MVAERVFYPMPLRSRVEEELIARAWKFFRRDPAELLGYDDAQAVAFGGLLVAKVDVFDETTDWLPGMSMADAGWKAAVAALSDVLVKGAKPLGVLLGLGLPEDSCDAADELFQGVEEACRRMGAHVWGGDTNLSDHLYLSVTAVGVAERLVPRGGAQPGDVLMVAGFGIISPVAYAVLLENAPLCPGAEAAIRRAYRPEPVDAGFWLNVSRYATASIDDSDGFALSLHYLAEASGVGLELDNLPMSQQLVECTEAWGRDPVELALYRGGEEYSFIFTVPPDKVEHVLAEAEKRGVGAHVIGRVARGTGVHLKGYGEVQRKGWSFGSWRDSIRSSRPS